MTCAIGLNHFGIRLGNICQKGLRNFFRIDKFQCEESYKFKEL